MIVVDASAAVAALVSTDPGGGRRRARVLCGDEIRSPDHMPAEVMSALRRLAYAGRISDRGADAALRSLIRLEFTPVPLLPLADLVWGWRHDLSVHDGWYVAAAHRFEAPLLTADRHLARAAAGRCDVELVG